MKLSNDLSIESLRCLAKVGIIAPIEYDEKRHTMVPFKSRLGYSHPLRYIPAVNWSQNLIISPVESYTFSICQSMQNIQIITNSGGCNKYCIKYIGKIDEQNFVIVYADGNKNGVLITKKSFLHNTKLSASKHNEDKARKSQKERGTPNGKALAITEMLHVMLKYSEVSSDLLFAEIETTSLETRTLFAVEYNNENKPSSKNRFIPQMVNDGAEIGNICDNARHRSNLRKWRHFTENQLFVLEEKSESKGTKLDRISEFSIRPPELCGCFDQVGNYYRWFHIKKKQRTKEELLTLLSPSNLFRSTWIDGKC